MEGRTADDDGNDSRGIPLPAGVSCAAAPGTLTMSSSNALKINASLDRKCFVILASCFAIVVTVFVNDDKACVSNFLIVLFV